MTPEEREYIQMEGLRFCFGYLPMIVAPPLAYSFLVPIAVTVLSELFKRRDRTSFAKWQLGVILFGIISFTAKVTIEFYYATSYVQITFIKLPHLHTHKTPRAVGIPLNALFWVITWLQRIQTLVNDAFIIWRAWIIFERRRWAWILCLCLWTLTFGCLLAGQVFNLLVLMWPTTEAILDGTVYLLLANTSGSFLLNGVTTCFIAIRLWQQVKFLRQSLEPEMRNSFKLWRVLFLLVDSGAIYGTLQLVLIIMNTGTEHLKLLPRTAVVDTYTYLFYSISFVYPALTIALIQGQSSIAGIHSTVSHVRGLSDSRGAELEVSKLKDHEHLETDPV